MARTVLRALDSGCTFLGATCIAQGRQSCAHHSCPCSFLSLRDLFLPFTGTAASLNESACALISAKLNHQLLSRESFPKGKLLLFPSETAHNITYTSFLWNDKRECYRAPAASTASACQVWGAQRSQALSPVHPVHLLCSSCNSPAWQCCCCSVTAVFQWSPFPPAHIDATLL